MRARLLLLTLLCASPWAQAMDCAIVSSPVMDFGSPDPFAGGDITTTLTMNWLCGNNRNGPPNNTMCVFVSSDSNGNVDPKILTASGTPTLPFNVYSDATYTTVIEPVVNGIIVPVSIGNQAGSIATGTVTLYGRIPGPLPADVRAELYQTVMANSQIHAVNGTSSNACTNIRQAPSSTYTLTATLNVPNQCQVTATNLDFGTQATPLAQVDSQSTVTVRCTNNSPYTVGLDGGLTGNRQMTNGTDLVSYELYQDAARSVEWNNTSSRQSGVGLGTGSAILLNVYGRLPADPAAVPGMYTDTVTVNVEF